MYNLCQCFFTDSIVAYDLTSLKYQLQTNRFLLLTDISENKNVNFIKVT